MRSFNIYKTVYNDSVLTQKVNRRPSENLVGFSKRCITDELNWAESSVIFRKLIKTLSPHCLPSDPTYCLEKVLGRHSNGAIGKALSSLLSLKHNFRYMICFRVIALNNH